MEINLWLFLVLIPPVAVFAALCVGLKFRGRPPGYYRSVSNRLLRRA